MISIKIDIRQEVINKFESLVVPKYKLLNTNTIFFEKELTVQYVTCKYGYNVFFRKDGSRVFPLALKGKDLIDIIHCLNQNKFFSYVYVENKRFKIKPKR